MTGCRRIARLLESFVDGELSGADRRCVTQHLEQCEPCAGKAQAFRDLGDVLRRAIVETPSAPDLAGLASGVMSRLQAEQAQSWGAKWSRAVEDCHWLIVGAGSITATFVLTTFASAVLIAGPAPQNKDSLAVAINTFGSSAGTLYVLATPKDDDRKPMLMQLDSDATPGSSESVAPEDLGFASEADLVRALAQTVMTPDGRLADLDSMPKATRAYAEGLLADINRLRSSDRISSQTGSVTVRRIVLRAQASVTAKGL